MYVQSAGKEQNNRPLEFATLSIRMPAAAPATLLQAHRFAGVAILQRAVSRLISVQHVGRIVSHAVPCNGLALGPIGEILGTVVKHSTLLCKRFE
jgi:hypothetical protein